MYEGETLTNLDELGEEEYRMLKETYCRVQGLRSDIESIHDEYALEGKPPGFDRIEALQLEIEELNGELERFLLPVCSTTSCGPAMCNLI